MVREVLEPRARLISEDIPTQKFSMQRLVIFSNVQIPASPPLKKQKEKKEANKQGNVVQLKEQNKLQKQALKTYLKKHRPIRCQTKKFKISHKNVQSAKREHN